MPLSLVGVSYSYGAETGEVRALSGLNLEVVRGEFVAVIGATGSGKSTFAKLLNGLLVPCEGDVWVFGMNTRDDDCIQEIRALVGMVFQNPDNQIVAGTVEEDVAFGPENLGLPSGEIRRRVEEALVAVGMDAHRNRAPHLLSGGQKQLVAVAGVLAMKPRCLVLDEPTAMLDPKATKEVLSTVFGLCRQEGISVLHITHSMREASEADRILVMDSGRLAMAGSPRDIFARSGELRRLGLDVPPAVELADILRGRGEPVPHDVITADHMVEYVCRQERIPVRRTDRHGCGCHPH
ncbi:MAG: energy-coupling factor transporter ATPase [Firmicutes bacterium]|nr:energy-coupling factor transporter ATPase [Bacillota bacterium]